RSVSWTCALGRKRISKAEWSSISIKATTRRSNRRLRGATADAAAGLTLCYREWEFLQRRGYQERFEFGHLLLGGLLHPFFRSGGKSFLQSLLTQRFFLQSNLRFGKSRQNPIPFFGILTSGQQRSWRQVRL